MGIDIFSLMAVSSYAFMLILFVCVAILNAKDMEVRKRDKWTRRDSAALLIRAVFYASLFGLAAACLEALGLFITTFALESILKVGSFARVSGTPLLILLSVFIVASITYGIAKKREFYELVDEEE